MTSRARGLANFFSPAVAATVGDAAGGGTEAVADVNSLPTNPSQGDFAYVTGTNKLYLWNGSAWYNIAIANQAPTAISGSLASYVLANDGTPTVLTLVSTDPEGFPLTWSATTSGDSQVGTVTNTDNVFTITPSTDEADIGTLSVTFSVTDGNNTETSVSSFTLAFLSPYWDETILSIGTSSTNTLDNSTFIDRSTNARTITPSGTPVQTPFHPYLDNWSVHMPSGAQASVPGTNLAPGTSEFCIEGWVHPKSYGNIIQIISQWNQGTGQHGVFIGSNGYLYFYRGNYGSGEAYRRTSTTVPLNEWTHVAVTRDSSNVWRFFL